DIEPAAGQVLVKTLCCGICGSDLHALHHMDHMTELARRTGAGGAPPSDGGAGIVFGHEFSAEILDHGPGAEKRLKAGTRVVSVPTLIRPSGMVSIGYSRKYPGGFAERMVLSESLLIEVPNGLSSRKAALTEPFAVGAHAVGRAALDEPAAVLVIGCGPVGLAVIASLKAKGYGPVTAADFSPTRRAMAERLGADRVIDPAEESPHARWSEMGVPASSFEQIVARTAGQPVKRAVIFECVGAPGVLQSVIEGAPAGAQIVVAGVCMTPDTIEPITAITKQIDLRFVYAYTPAEFAEVLRQIAEGEMDVEPVITGVVGLDGVANAFEQLSDPESQVKILVEPAAAG
ncbi:MAG TPA: zinc-binding dehydrogenase, partial [Caulobacteraceae bacterium]|nr:zinc-binding dehydrogenase [Caulobacteraceae bacterium]